MLSIIDVRVKFLTAVSDDVFQLLSLRTVAAEISCRPGRMKENCNEADAGFWCCYLYQNADQEHRNIVEIYLAEGHGQALDGWAQCDGPEGLQEIGQHLIKREKRFFVIYLF